VIFVDSNIPMYLIGAPHRHKTDAQRLLFAVMERHGIDTILSLDSGFDGFPGIKRLAS